MGNSRLGGRLTSACLTMHVTQQSRRFNCLLNDLYLKNIKTYYKYYILLVYWRPNTFSYGLLLYYKDFTIFSIPTGVAFNKILKMFYFFRVRKQLGNICLIFIYFFFLV